MARHRRERPPDQPAGGRIVALRGVEKTYRAGRTTYPALRGIDLEIGAGELAAIVGPSGCGKSTLLNVITGIDRPSAGSVVVDGADLADLDEDELAAWRGGHVGIVFQFFQLLPTLTALENAMLPLDFGPSMPAEARTAAAMANLARVGLDDKRDHLPMELSGGEQQRVAIARAMARDPALLVADEPTGNLDSHTAAQMLDLLTALNRAGTTVLYVTHDEGLAGAAGRVVRMRDGRVIAGE